MILQDFAYLLIDLLSLLHDALPHRLPALLRRQLLDFPPHDLPLIAKLIAQLSQLLLLFLFDFQFFAHHGTKQKRRIPRPAPIPNRRPTGGAWLAADSSPLASTAQVIQYIMRTP